MSQNFRTYVGKIGTWRGIPVDLMGEDQYNDIKKLKEDRIYALRHGRKMDYANVGDLDMAFVLKGMVIGSMDLEGNIVEFDTPTRYKKPKKSISFDEIKPGPGPTSTLSLSVDEILTIAMEENIWAKVMFEMPEELMKAMPSSGSPYFCL